MKQRYVSSELTHFTGQGLDSDDKRYDRLRTIVSAGTLKSGLGYSMAMHPDKPLSSHDRIVTAAVCFCDIPVQDFEIHMKKYSRFGLSFRKKFLISEYGASPVFYVAESAPNRSLFQLVYGIKTRKELYDALGEWLHETTLSREKQIEVESPPIPMEPERFGKPPTVRHEGGHKIIDATGNAVRLSSAHMDMEVMTMSLNEHLLSFLKFFNPNLPEGHVDNTYMEREWRVLGNVEFRLSDIERVVIPRRYARRLRQEFPRYHGQVTIL